MENGMIGKKIKKLRKKFKMTQTELANKIHVTDGAISKWETNKSVPDYDTLKKIAKMFNVKITYFLEENKKKSILLLIISFIKKYWHRILLILLLFLLFIYFITTYNSFQMYEIKIDDDNISMAAGYYIKSKNKVVLDLNNIKIKQLDNNIINTKIKLYTLVNDEKIYFYESDNLEYILIKQFTNSEEYINKKLIKQIPKSLYIEIEQLKDNGEINIITSMASFKKVVDSKWLFKSHSKLDYENFSTNNSNEINDDSDMVYNLINKGFKPTEDKNIYVKKYKDKDVYVDLNIHKMFFTLDSQNIENVDYYYDDQILIYIAKDMKKDNRISRRFNYYVLTGELDCDVGKCDDYIKVYKKTMDVYYNVCI